jgi:hypothetical protein
MTIDPETPEATAREVAELRLRAETIERTRALADEARATAEHHERVLAILRHEMDTFHSAVCTRLGLDPDTAWAIDAAGAVTPVEGG